MLKKLFIAAILTMLAAHGKSANAQNSPSPIPQPHFQGDFFGEMPRAFGAFVRIDTKARVVVVRRDGDGKIVTVPIRDDTELHFRELVGRIDRLLSGPACDAVYVRGR